MSRCPYCRRQLPGFETLCQNCFEAGYDRIKHPIPWWKRIRLTYTSLYVFLIVFGYGFVLLRINRDNHLTMIGFAGLAFVLAAFMILLASLHADFDQPHTTRALLCLFLASFVVFFLRVWTFSTYHPFPMPTLFSLLVATIAALRASIQKYPLNVEQPQKKAPGENRRL